MGERFELVCRCRDALGSGLPLAAHAVAAKNVFAWAEGGCADHYIEYRSKPRLENNAPRSLPLLREHTCDTRRDGRAQRMTVDHDAPGRDREAAFSRGIRHPLKDRKGVLVESPLSQARRERLRRNDSLKPGALAPTTRLALRGASSVLKSRSLVGAK